MRGSLIALAVGLATLCSVGGTAGTAKDRPRTLSPESTSASAPGPPNLKGWWIILGSAPAEHTGGVQAVIDVAARCDLQAFHDLSTDFSGFSPQYLAGFRSEYNVVLAGPFTTRENAEHKLQDTKICVPDAFLEYGEYAAGMPVQPTPISSRKRETDASPSAIPSDAQSSAAYEQGQADRQSWESWFATLSGQYRAGAEYWAAHRSDPKPASCKAAPPATGAEWTAGCFTAQQRLAHVDVRRKTEPEYRLG